MGVKSAVKDSSINHTLDFNLLYFKNYPLKIFCIIEIVSKVIFGPEYLERLIFFINQCV